MKDPEKMTLEELQKSHHRFLNEYMQFISSMKNDRIGKKVIEDYYGYPLEKIAQEITEREEEIRSRLIFPGDLILFYPNITEQKSKVQRTCDFSGGIIHPGSLYIRYRPLLDNISRNEKYVLKHTICVESGYTYDLPTTISEFEELEQNMITEKLDSEIDFNHLNAQMGGAFYLTKLKARKRR